MVQGLNSFKGSIRLRDQFVQGFNWLKGSRLQWVQRFNCTDGLLMDLINLSFQMVQGFNWFKGSNGSKVQMVYRLNFGKGSIVVRV